MAKLTSSLTLETKIKNRLSKFLGKSQEGFFSDKGSVLSVGDGIATVYGLNNVQAGEIVNFQGGIKGTALNLENNKVGIVIFGNNNNVKEGSLVTRLNIENNVTTFLYRSLNFLFFVGRKYSLQSFKFSRTIKNSVLALMVTYQTHVAFCMWPFNKIQPKVKVNVQGEGRFEKSSYDLESGDKIKAGFFENRIKQWEVSCNNQGKAVEKYAAISDKINMDPNATQESKNSAFDKYQTVFKGHQDCQEKLGHFSMSWAKLAGTTQKEQYGGSGGFEAGFETAKSNASGGKPMATSPIMGGYDEHFVFFKSVSTEFIFSQVIIYFSSIFLILHVYMFFLLIKSFLFQEYVFSYVHTLKKINFGFWEFYLILFTFFVFFYINLACAIYDANMEIIKIAIIDNNCTQDNLRFELGTIKYHYFQSIGLKAQTPCELSGFCKSD